MRLRLTLLLLISTAGCGGVSLTGELNNAQVPGQWAARIIAPSTTLIAVTPSAPAQVFIQALPVNGYVLGGTTFENAFTTANPQIPSAICPKVVTIVNDGLVPPPIGFGSDSTLQLTLNYAGTGSCAVPFNLGAAGSISVPVLTGPDILPTPTPH